MSKRIYSLHLNIQAKTKGLRVRRYTYHVQINDKVRWNAKLIFLDEESSDGTSSQDTYQAEAQ
jgi:hypothetical protein